MPSDTWKLLNDVRKFIEAEYSDPGAAPDGEWLAKDARPIHDRICTALANYSASIPAGLDAVDMDMTQRGDRLGPELGARVASALSSLSARVGELEKALEPFAEIADGYDENEDDAFEVWKDFDVLGASLPLRIFRRARAALRGEAS